MWAQGHCPSWAAFSALGSQAVHGFPFEPTHRSDLTIDIAIGPRARPVHCALRTLIILCCSIGKQWRPPAPTSRRQRPLRKVEPCQAYRTALVLFGQVRRRSYVPQRRCRNQFGPMFCSARSNAMPTLADSANLNSARAALHWARERRLPTVALTLARWCVCGVLLQGRRLALLSGRAPWPLLSLASAPVGPTFAVRLKPTRGTTQVGLPPPVCAFDTGLTSMPQWGATRL